MKAAKGSIGRAVDRPDPNIRFYLFYGADEAQSRSLADRLLKSLAADKSVIAAGAIRSDPALLSDEAGAISLFGGKRLVWVEPAGEEIVEGVKALLEAPPPESPVVAIAGALRKTSALLKLAEASPVALANVSYVPEGQAAERMIEELAAAEGLRLRPGVAARVAAACGNDRAIAAQELAKLALFVGAAPDAPKELDSAALDAVGADMPEGDFLHLADMALSGDLRDLADELAALSPAGAEAVPVVRSLQRRLMMIAPLRARVDEGQTPAAVMASMGKSLFWKDEPLIGKLLRQWDSAGLARVADRLGQLERDLMLTDAPKTEALGEELTAIARKARAR